MIEPTQQQLIDHFGIPRDTLSAWRDRYHNQDGSWRAQLYRHLVEKFYLDQGKAVRKQIKQRRRKKQ